MVRGLGAWRSPATRRRCAPVTAGLAVVALALAPMTGAAQMPAPAPGSVAELLQPSLDGKPATPPRFRRPEQTTLSPATQPPPGKFTAPTRIGATPIYGSPTGFGAGNTGFDSSNAPRRRKRPKTPPTTTEIAPPQPEATFTPVPTFAPPAPAPPKRPSIAKPPPAEIYPLKAANRPGVACRRPPNRRP